MLRRCMRPSKGHGVDEPTVDSEEHASVLRSLAQFAGVGRRAPSLSPAAGALASPAVAAADSPPSFLVNMAAAATPNSTTMPPQQGSASFSSTPTLVRRSSSHGLMGARSAVAAAAAAAAAARAPAAPAPAPAPAPALPPALDLLPAERRLVWTQSKSRREASLLQEAKLGMSGVREDEAGGGGGGEEPEAEQQAFGGDLDEDNEEEDDDGDGTGFGADGPFGSREDRRRLRLRLARLGLARQLCEGDGSCLFRAVSAQLYGGSQDHHAAVRAAAVQHMLDHRADYEAFLGEDVGAYLAGMAVPGTWGDELTLRAISDALGVVVHVVTSGAEGWYTVYVPPPSSCEEGVEKKGQEEEQEEPPPAVFLSYLAPVHYDGLVPAPRL